MMIIIAIVIWTEVRQKKKNERQSNIVVASAEF